MLKNTRASGQALIEYLFIFAFLSFLSIGIVRYFGTTVSNSIDSLAFVLTQELSTGVCPERCFTWGSYINQVEDN